MARRRNAPTRGGGRPRGYFATDGEKVPASTTITGRFKDPGGLYYGHWRNGYAGREYNDWGTDAAAIGTVVHGMVEQYIHGEPVEEPKTLEAVTGFNSFVEWWEAGKFRVEITEQPLISERYRFGGTPDAIGRDYKRRRCLFDWKSSNGIYPDYLWQIASYGLLYAEHYEEPLEGGYHLVRFSKEHGDFEHRHFTELNSEARLFLMFREAFDLDKIVAKRAK